MIKTRRLAAIVAADVVGFSSQMEQDEEGTVARIKSLRSGVIDPLLAEGRGRLVKTTGDGFLAEFASPIAAVGFAMAVQGHLNREDGFRLRIGINLGDVIVEEDGDVYGEGVNVAARLEAICEPGGVLISSKIHEEVQGKIEATFEDQGEQQVKNISRLVHVYSVYESANTALRQPLRSNTTRAAAARPPQARGRTAAVAALALVIAGGAGAFWYFAAPHPLPSADVPGAAAPGTDAQPASALFDGSWNTTITCDPVEGSQTSGYVQRLVVLVQGGRLHGEMGSSGMPGYFVIDGPIHADGTARLSARGLIKNGQTAVGNGQSGATYTYTANVQFQQRSGSGTRNEFRPCRLQFER